MRSNLQSLRKNRKAASPAVSAVIITAATVVLVIISSLYALQVLTRQEAQAELETSQNSILAFDDALRDIAWDRDGSRSVRFTAKYGNMRLIDEGKSLNITVSGVETPFSREVSTAVVKYQLPNSYGISGSGSSYILGDNRTVVSKLSDDLGQALLAYESELASISLNYRVRLSEGGTIQVGYDTVTYVDIFVIKLTCNSSAIGASDFDLTCRNIGLATESFTYDINGPISITVTDGTESDTVNLTLAGDLVSFNLITAEVRVSA